MMFSLQVFSKVTSTHSDSIRTSPPTHATYLQHSDLVGFFLGWSVIFRSLAYKDFKHPALVTLKTNFSEKKKSFIFAKFSYFFFNQFFRKLSVDWDCLKLTYLFQRTHLFFKTKKKKNKGKQRESCLFFERLGSSKYRESLSSER